MCQRFHLRLNHLLLPQNKYHNSQTESVTTVQRSAGLANEGWEMCYCNSRSLLLGPGTEQAAGQEAALAATCRSVEEWVWLCRLKVPCGIQKSILSGVFTHKRHFLSHQVTGWGQQRVKKEKRTLQEWQRTRLGKATRVCTCPKESWDIP